MWLNRCRYTMPPQSQQSYWESEWSRRVLQKQIANGPKKAWWPILLQTLKDLPRDALILEAGCGMGQFVFHIHAMDRSVIGIDITQKALRETKSAYPDLPLLVQDVRQLGIGDQKVDLLISLGVVEHFEAGPHTILAEAARVVRPGGRLFITVPYTNLFRRFREPWRRLRQKLGPNNGRVFYQYTFSSRWFCERLREAGFSPDQVFLHHSHVAIKKDLPWLTRLHRPFFRASDSKKYRLWGQRLDWISPFLASHMLLVVATRRSKG